MYLFVQAIGCFLWWLSVLFWPGFREYFVFGDRGGDGGETALMFFGYGGSFIFYGGLSWLAACGLLDGKSWGLPALWIHIGAAGYAIFFTASLAARTGSGWLGAFVMTPPLVISLWLAIRLREEEGYETNRDD